MRRQNGFTLVELLVVIAIIGILVALLLPAVQAAREAARRSECLNKMRQLGIASHNHLGVRGYFPSSANAYGGGFLLQLLPFVEEQELYDLFDHKEVAGGIVNREAWSRSLPISRCPSMNDDHETVISAIGEGLALSDGDDWRSHYYAVLGAKPDGSFPCPGTTPYGPLLGNCAQGGYATNGIMFPESKLPVRQISDGTTQTLLIGESSWDFYTARVWVVGSTALPPPGPQNHTWAAYAGRNVAVPMNTASSRGGIGPRNDIAYGSNHPGGAHFTLGDGSSRFISENIEMTTFKALASRAIEETVGAY